MRYAQALATLLVAPRPLARTRSRTRELILTLALARDGGIEVNKPAPWKC